ncbi:MAG: methylenetetrahydrofolate reductase C-terminal domain-containing protein, partial [Chloroflexi bacterium]|nr:methylenetetrahydrofolate reductase C-terminal domain-containing protein [Chloroflexota bacterium]
ARCSKQLLNGPCGGSSDAKCEVNADIECAWQLIYDKLKAQGRLNLIMEITPPKDWRTSRDGGPRKIVREDLRLVMEKVE